MKIYGFSAKWRMLCQHSWYSFLKYAHIGHKRVSWNREQCCRRNFLFSVHEKSFFYFRMQKMGYFVNQLPKICRKIGAIHYSKILDHIYLQITKWLCVKQFPSNSRKKHKFLPIQLEGGQSWTTGASLFSRDFLKKSYLVTQVPISS